MLAWIFQPSWPSTLSNTNYINSFFDHCPIITSISSHFSNMSQTPPQDQVDLVQTNGTGHDTSNTERMPFPKPISTEEQPPTSTQEQPPASSQPQTVAHEPLDDSSKQPRSSSLPPPSSKTDISPEAPIDTDAIPNGPDTQTNQAQLPQEDLGSSKDPLEAYDWDELEERFRTEMEKCANQEEEIQGEFHELLKVICSYPSNPAHYTHRGICTVTVHAKIHQLFKTWTATASIHEENRAGKRYGNPLIQLISPSTTKATANKIQSLRTRMSYVQHREQTLEEKRTHCKCLSLFRII